MNTEASVRTRRSDAGSETLAQKQKQKQKRTVVSVDREHRDGCTQSKSNKQYEIL